ncbi:MAG: MraY family glycosyltransferase [Candidatus Paceibacterota bacterium]
MDVNLLVWLFVSLSISLILIIYGVPKVIEIANLKKLFDDYKNERKIHDEYIPNIGGLVIIMTFIIAFSIHPASKNLTGYELLMAATIILMAVGLKDDLLIIATHKKFLGELVVSSIVILGMGLHIQSLGGLFGIYELPYAVSIALTYFLFIGLINAINLIDGIDGLAASVTVVASIFFGYWFYITGNEALFVFSAILAGCYGSFLWFNWSPAKVFMGDTGALFSGFYLAFLSVHFLNSGITGVTIAGWQSSMAVVLMSILILPVYDTARVSFIRIFSGKSPFHADANHIHHNFLEMGLSHTQTTSSLVLINLFIVGFVLLMSPYLSINALFFSVILLCLIALPTVRLKRNVISYLRSLTLSPQRELYKNGNGYLVLNSNKNGVYNGSFSSGSEIKKTEFISTDVEVAE